MYRRRKDEDGKLPKSRDKEKIEREKGQKEKTLRKESREQSKESKGKVANVRSYFYFSTVRLVIKKICYESDKNLGSLTRQGNWCNWVTHVMLRPLGAPP